MMLLFFFKCFLQNFKCCQTITMNGCKTKFFYARLESKSVELNCPTWCLARLECLLDIFKSQWPERIRTKHLLISLLLLLFHVKVNMFLGVAATLCNFWISILFVIQWFGAHQRLFKNKRARHGVDITAFELDFANSCLFNYFSNISCAAQFTFTNVEAINRNNSLYGSVNPNVAALLGSLWWSHTLLNLTNYCVFVLLSVSIQW